MAVEQGVQSEGKTEEAAPGPPPPAETAAALKPEPPKSVETPSSTEPLAELAAFAAALAGELAPPKKIEAQAPSAEQAEAPAGNQKLVTEPKTEASKAEETKD